MRWCAGGNRAYLVDGDATRPGFRVPVATVASWFGGSWDPAEEIELGAATVVTDLDDDGYGDVVVGGPKVSDTALNAGAAYVWTGSATRFPAGATDISAAALTVSGTSVSQLVGISVATGDLDGDGRADLAIGAFGWDEPATDAGLVGVLFGGGSPSGAVLVTDVDVRIEGAFGGDYLAWVSAGDLTGDGYDDLFVGASGAAGNDGAVYLVGGADL